VPPLELPRQDAGGGAVDLASLSHVPSVQLFVERASAAVPEFALTTRNAAVIVQICRRLDGLPLALELAAPWTGLLGPEALLDRLDRRLPLLVDGPQDLPARQQSLRATLAWSCDLLSPAQRSLLCRLSVFAGSAPVDGVEVVGQAAGELPSPTLQLLGALADHSLVMRRMDASGPGRVTMLETVREYGRELLDAARETDATSLAHAEYYAALTARARPEMDGPHQANWLQRFEVELDNIRAALQWARRGRRMEVALRLASNLAAFWDRREHRREGLSWLETLLAESDRVPPSLRARALRQAGTLARMLFDFELADKRLRESADIYNRIGDRHSLAHVQYAMGASAWQQGLYPRACALLEEAVLGYRETDDETGVATAHGDLAAVLQQMGEPQRAREMREQSLAAMRRLGHMYNVALSLVNMADLAQGEGDGAEARAHLEEAVELGRTLELPYPLAAALANLGGLTRGHDPAQATDCYEESLRLFVRIENGYGIATCIEGMAWIAWAEGSLSHAALLYGAAAGLRVTIGAPPQPVAFAEHRKALAAIRDAIGERRLAELEVAGRRLFLEEAVATALAGPPHEAAEPAPSE
jgi:tetratricopeptide (TPR) repeat protein